ncbi:MAG: NYN domain-containing protein [Chloroflexi bacterium]|nr:NYN domain-containing protein [Chloroflexota bacterium]
MGKNVAVFVDVANIFYAAKAAGVDVDYVDLLKHASAGRDLVRAYAYTGLDPENENQRNFHSFLARHGYKVVSKDIRKYGDGKVKANLDIELVVDMMKTARNLDIAIVVSGDGDFAPAIRAVQEMGVRVEVVSFRGNTSSDLIEVADLFTDITRIASSDRAAVKEREAGEADLSMTVVPEKESEGSGRGRGRGRGRTTKAAETARTEEPRRATRSRGRAAAAETAEVPAASGRGGLVALPGEKLSRAASRPAAAEEPEEELEAGEVGVGPEDGSDETGEAPRRRRRRRGGRGRGRGHDRAEGEGVDVDAPRTIADLEGVETIRLDDEAEDDEEVEAEVEEAASLLEAPTPARRASQSFGSVWDSQMGMAGAPRVEPGTSAVDEEIDEDEPAIPEYLIAERRGGGRGQGARGGGRGQGARGGRAGYSAAVDRERFGGRGGGRMAEPPRSGAASGPRGNAGRGGGDVRGGQQRNDRPDRPQRTEHGAAFSDVPPELEAMLRAQLAAKSAGSTVKGTATGEPATGRQAATQTGGRGRGRGAKAAAAGDGGAAEAPVPTAAAVPGAPVEGARDASAPKARGTRGRRAAEKTETGPGPEATAAPVAAVDEPGSARPVATPRGRGRGRTAGGGSDAGAPTGAAADAAAAEGPTTARGGAEPTKRPRARRAAAPTDAKAASEDAPTAAADGPAADGPATEAADAAKPRRAPRARKAGTAG